MPSLQLTQSQKNTWEEFRDFGRSVLRPFAEEADRIGDIPSNLLARPEVIEAMHAFVPVDRGGGWVSKIRPETRHDLASSAISLILANEAAGYGDVPLWIAMPGPGLAAPILQSSGSAEQQATFFSAFQGDTPCWGAFAMSEPGAGSDVSGIKTWARREGDCWVLNGTKWFIGNGARAKHLVVFATVNPAQGQFGIRGFLVQRGSPGFRIGQILPTMGLRAVQIAELIFEDCRIPFENMLGAGRKSGWRDSGFHNGIRTFNVFRPSVAAMGVGIGSAALDFVDDVIQQNGAQHIWARAWNEARNQVERIRGKLCSTRLLSWKAAWLHDHGHDNAMVACMAKVFGAETAMEACLAAMDICAEAGGVPHHYLQRLFRDAKAIDLLEGTGDVQRLNVARSLLTPARTTARRNQTTSSAGSAIFHPVRSGAAT